MNPIDEGNLGSVRLARRFKESKLATKLRRFSQTIASIMA